MIFLYYAKNHSTAYTQWGINWDDLFTGHFSWWIISHASTPSTPDWAELTLPLIYLFTNMLSLLLISVVEGNRLGRFGTLMSFPSLLMISMRFQGYGGSALSYALLSALHSAQITVDRTVPIEVAKSLVPALVSGFIIPAFLLVSPILGAYSWQSWISVLPLIFPILTTVCSTVLRMWQGRVSGEDAQKHIEWYSTDDVPYLKSAYFLIFVAQAVAHATLLTSNTLKIGLVRSLLGSVMGPMNSTSEVAHLDYELLWFTLGAVSHSLYSIWELRQLGYINTSWALKTASATFLGQFLVGPGASWVSVYYWRENILLKLSSTSSP
jgi:hypothetical protein